MLSKKLLTMGVLSTLLTSTILFAEEKHCENGVCFAIFSKTTTIKTFKEEQKKVVNLEKLNELDKSITIVLDGDEIMVFPSYKMTDSEYYLTEEEMKYENESEEFMDNPIEELIVHPLEKIEDTILEKSKLKDSLYYCENETKPQFNEFTNLYQCV